MSENSRIAFIMERDGEEAADKWVEQGLAIYIEAAIHESKYKDSIQEYIRFLEEDGTKTVEILTVKETT